MLGPGDVLGDRYRLDEFVASGGMGQVFRATDKTLNRTVAVKVLLPGLTSDAEFGSRFRAEARIMASIGHPGVVGVYDYGESPEGTMFLVMAYVEGRPLGERITREGALPVADTMAIVAQAADALHAAHRNGIIHRDVKPNNLLVSDNGAVTLVDFGVARSSNVTSVTKVNAVIGTALYMSPEQASGKPISPATDIYALGAVAYHCLTGAPPFTGSSPLEIAIKHLQDEPPPLPAELPGSVRALVERAMAKDPQDRFPTAAALAAAARAAQDPTLQDAAVAPALAPRRTATVTAPRPAVVVPPDGTGPRRDRPAWIPVAVGAALLAVAGGVVLAILALTGDNDRKEPPAGGPGVSPTATVVTSGPAPGGGGATRTSAAPSTSAPASASPSTAATTAAPPPASSEPPPVVTTPPPAPTTGGGGGGTTPPVDASVPPA
ncbi:serine/threonine-protein kinase [Dactylosporangium aurantiacum]|uniref:serine/threonine-protein kinase n=1 Tax=Dactylosporangium aurantiacum TaxID=35754 RepID=UPI001FDF701E|nr:serine/threonine-protein kinase [Dactylosporangium aurantiacum]MDG6101362.1 serine/threonine-protein kinase [Dactylosporangium aurantiacum]